MRDQKYLRKNFHKFATFHVKDFANKVKRATPSLSKAFSSQMNPELKLENQGSLSSMFNDPNANINTTASGAGASSNDGSSVIYDYEEGIRKHNEKVYGPVLSLLVQ
jgi:hypothetical protein